MLDYNQEKKLELLLSLIDLPSEMPTRDQLRDGQGKYTESPKQSKSDSDDVIWVHCGNGTFVRRRKTRYVIYDCVFIFSILGAFALIM
jgi:hypothetical protein